MIKVSPLSTSNCHRSVPTGPILLFFLSSLLLIFSSSYLLLIVIDIQEGHEEGHEHETTPKKRRGTALSKACSSLGGKASVKSVFNMRWQLPVVLFGQRHSVRALPG